MIGSSHEEQTLLSNRMGGQQAPAHRGLPLPGWVKGAVGLPSQGKPRGGELCELQGELLLVTQMGDK